MNPTKTLIILGNGFDLDLGWKTSYNDFFQSKRQYLFILNGMSYIRNMIESEYWYDLEGYLRNIAITEGTSKNKLEKLSHFWRVLTTKLEEYFTDDSIYLTNYNSCAY